MRRHGTDDLEPRYRRSTEIMYVLRELLDGRGVDFHGDFVDLTIEPPRIRTVSGRSPLFYFGGLSPAARECAAVCADVFLMWPDVTENVLEAKADMDARAAAKGRSLRYGWRSHVIVRETETEARAAAQTALRDGADDEGYADRHLWTGVGRDVLPHINHARLEFEPDPVNVG